MPSRTYAYTFGPSSPHWPTMGLPLTWTMRTLFATSSLFCSPIRLMVFNGVSPTR